jgi:O-antigen ligase
MFQTLSFDWWNSKAARRIDVVAVGAAICLLCRLVWQEDLGWIGAVVLFASVVVLTATRWPYGALVVLIGTSALPVFFAEIFGWKARPEHFAAVIVFLAVAVWMFLSKCGVQLDKLDYWILAFVFLNFASSAFGSSAPASTLRWALQNSLAVLSYFLIRSLVRDLSVLRSAFRVLLAVGLLESIYGILCYVLHQTFDTSIGVQVGQYLSDVAAPYGSQYEPNLFGAYTACSAVLFLALYLFQARRLTFLMGFLVASLAAVLSFSRAALLALIVAVSYLFWRDFRRRRKERGKRTVFFALSLVLLLILASTSVGGVVRERFMNLYYQGLTDDTAISRVIVAQEALQEIPNHLILGSGTASFNLSFDWSNYVPEWAGEKTWIGNTPLRILHDTGVLGLTAFVGFFLTAAYRIRRLWKAKKGSNAILIGLSAGTLVYAISFELTDGTILAFCWVHLGLLASAVILLNNLAEEEKHAVV